jgi:signal transduction histidine kinase
MKTRPSRSPISPRATLVLTLGAAAAVLLAGIWLSWRQEKIHVVGNRAPVQAVGEEMETQFGQLERLYEKHLRALAAATAGSTDDAEISRTCDTIVGVAQWSLVHNANGAYRDLLVPVDFAVGTQWPKPAFQLNPDDVKSDVILLSKDDLFQADGPTWGWVNDAGKPPLFWQRVGPKSDAVVVLLIDVGPLRAALNDWLEQWAGRSFSPLGVRDGPVCALESDGATLLATSTLPAAAPDFVLPVRSFFGTWEIMAWDPVVLRTTYDYRILAGAGFLAVLIVVLGVLAYLQQKRLLAQTAQQVTFVNRVSHELRSPLTNILLNLELGQEMLGDQAQAPARRLALVQEEALRLRRLVDNVLAFSALEREKYRWENRACVPDHLVQAVIAQFAAAFIRRGLNVRFAGHAGSACVLDADAVAQILANLFSNLEKYVPPGTVDIATALDANVLTVMVRDEGAGVPVAESERIFRPFERLDGRINEGASGTGLGLSIARELALGMGGSLRLVPSGVGATFELRVPAFSAAETSP